MGTPKPSDFLNANKREQAFAEIKDGDQLKSVFQATLKKQDDVDSFHAKLTFLGFVGSMATGLGLRLMEFPDFVVYSGFGAFFALGALSFFTAGGRVDKWNEPLRYIKEQGEQAFPETELKWVLERN